MLMIIFFATLFMQLFSSSKPKRDVVHSAVDP